MRRLRRSGGFLANAWLVTGTSLLAIVALSVLLWSPWDRPGISGGKRLRLYCAAGLQPAVAEIIKNYARDYDVSVEPTYGGSGELLAMIRAAGGAGDLFLSADARTMEEGRKSGDIAEVIPVVVMRPVLVVNKKTQKKLQAEGRKVTTVFDLLREDLKVILANDKGASIGKVGRRVLEPLGIWAKLEERRRSGAGIVASAGTVNKVAETVALADGYIGIVWDAVAIQFPTLEVVKAREFKGKEEQVLIGVVKRSRQPTAALQFARYLTARDRGEKVFAEKKYTPIPDADIWAEHPRIHVSAGAMLKPAVQDALKAFEQREGVQIVTAYNGCGVLVSTMEAIKFGQEGAKKFPDAYFACDISFLDEVQQWFGDPVTVSRNDVVLVVRKGNPKGIESLADLSRPEVRVGLAHPKKAALGKLTEDRLKQLGLYERVYAEGWQQHIVHADAAHDLVNKMLVGDRGARDVAVVYRSNVNAVPKDERDQLLVLPVNVGTRATQPFAIARETRHPYLLRRLRDALLAGPSARRFHELGFEWAYKK
jgi:molybdenum ABC transporter molybdate-binding protein